MLTLSQDKDIQMKNSGLLILLLLCGCASAPVQETPSFGSELPGSDTAACVGQVPATVQGLSAASNDQLIAAARGLPDKGGVCAAAVFAAVEPVQVYRVYDSAKSYSALGSWWALTRPDGTLDQYRAAFAICPEWGPRDRLVVCRLKPGSQIVLGTTQSIKCAGETSYPQSANIQVYIPNDSRAQTVYVDECAEEAIWPELKQAATE